VGDASFPPFLRVSLYPSPVSYSLFPTKCGKKEDRTNPEKGRYQDILFRR
jgi:hypothetical protein